MKLRQLQEKMRQEAQCITPDLSEKLPKLSAYTDLPEKPRILRRHMTAILASAVACLLLVMGVGLYTGYQTEATIVLAVNPEVELMINPYDQVIDAVALNSDGEKLLQRVKLKNRKIGTAIQLLMTGMEDQGYLQEENQVRVQVQCDKQGRKEKLEQTIEDQVNTFFAERTSKGTVEFTDHKEDTPNQDATPAGTDTRSETDIDKEENNSEDDTDKDDIDDEKDDDESDEEDDKDDLDEDHQDDDDQDEDDQDDEDQEEKEDKKESTKKNNQKTEITDDDDDQDDDEDEDDDEDSQEDDDQDDLEETDED